MPKGPQLTTEMRTACIVLRYSVGRQHAAIAEELNLKPATVRATCTRIQKATGSTNLLELLQHCGTCQRSGRPLKVKPGSPEANRIRAAVKANKYQVPEEVAQWVLQQRQPLGSIHPNTVSASTTRRVLREKRFVAADPINVKKITRNRELQKNLLTERHLDLRRTYCDQVDTWYQEHALVITTDEYQEHFGGSSKSHINVNQGESRYGSQAPIRFSREQWAACSEDLSIQRPHCIWEAEKASNHMNWHRQLQDAKEVLKKEVQQRRARCSQEGTPEWITLQKRNKQVDEDNENRWLRRQKGERCGSLHYYTPERLFPYERIEKEEEKGGLDFLFMAFEIYRKYLFPYARALALNNPSRQVVILEDNDGSHIKARRLLAPEVLALEEDFGIIFGAHPPNSPELALIETLHGYERRALRDFRFNVNDAKQSTKDEADRRMKEWWQALTNDHLIAEKSSIERLKILADLCRVVDFGNGFKDD